MTTSPPPIDPFSSADLGPLKLRNRFVKAATFEGLELGNGGVLNRDVARLERGRLMVHVVRDRQKDPDLGARLRLRLCECRNAQRERCD